MIPHDQPAKLHTRLLEAPALLAVHPNISIIIFQIRAVGIRTQIAPTADAGIPDVAVMRLIRVVLNHRLPHLSSDLTMLPYSSRPIDLSPHTHLGKIT